MIQAATCTPTLAATQSTFAASLAVTQASQQNHSLASQPCSDSLACATCFYTGRSQPMVFGWAVLLGDHGAACFYASAEW